MKALKAEDLRAFTQALFLGTVFDRFLLREAEFRTFCTFTVNGAAEVRWYSEEELESERVEEYTSWEKLRPLCFSLIRGKRTPIAFRLDMKLAPGDAEKLCAEITELYPDAEVEMNYGGQPVYYYFISAE